MEKKITFVSVFTDAFGIAMKNIPSILGALILWLLTIWIPYINVGTTIAMCSMPIELAKGNVMSPTFIFDGKYRQFMGEFFTLLGLMLMSLSPAYAFMIVPGIIISIGWSLAIYIMLDKGIAPGEALIRSNKATKGYKWTIFFVNLAISLGLYIFNMIFANFETFGALLILIVTIIVSAISLACNAVIYKNLTAEVQES